MAYKDKICFKCGTVFTPTSGRQLQCDICKNRILIKKCKACGKNFKPIRNSQEFCHISCQRAFKEYVNNSTLDHPYISESERMASPTEDYIREIDYLLKDFGINVDMPTFDTVSDLDRWKSQIILSHL